MVSGFIVAMVLTWIYPDDIRALGSLTGGIVGIVVNLAVYLGAAMLVKTDDVEKARVAEMFRSGEDRRWRKRRADPGRFTRRANYKALAEESREKRQPDLQPPRLAPRMRSMA